MPAGQEQRGSVEAWQPRKGYGVAGGALPGDFQLQLCYRLAA